MGPGDSLTRGGARKNRSVQFQMHLYTRAKVLLKIGFLFLKEINGFMLNVTD